MNEAPILTRSSTATGTRSFANRLGTHLVGRAESVGETTRSAPPLEREPTPVGHYLTAEALPGINALIDHCRKQQAAEIDTTEFPLVGAETGVVYLRDDRLLFFDALLQGLGQVPQHWRDLSSGHPIEWPIEMQFSDQEATESLEADIEIVDWDIRIETPPPRPSQHVVVRFQEGSYRLPRIVDDPED